MKKLYILPIFVIFFTSYTFSQSVSINTDGSNADASSILDIKSTDKGILIPRMSSAQRTAISSPATGLMVYDSDMNQFYYYNGTAWVQAIGPTGATGPAGPVGSTGPVGPTGPLVAGSSGQTLRHDGTTWVANSTIFNNGTNVGIGNSTPQARLHIGSIDNDLRLQIDHNSVSTFGTAVLLNETQAGNSDGPKIAFRKNTPNKNWSIGILNGVAESGFAINEDGSDLGFGTSRFYIGAGGNVGVGTTTPEARIHSAGQFMIQNTDPTIFLRDTDHRSGMIHMNSNLMYFLSGSGVNSTNWTVNGSYWPLTINMTNDVSTFGGNVHVMEGNIGIGTENPAQRLTIEGTGNIFGVDNQASFVARNSGGDYETYFWPRWSDNVMYMNYGTGGMHIRNNSSATTMFMTNNNNVGIGNTNPVERLDVTGNIRASGIVYWGNSFTRTETRDNAGLQGDAGARSGFFETSAPSPAANWYPGASSWQHLLDVRHSNNSNNYALQIAGSFFDQRLWFRKTNNNPAQQWTEIAPANTSPPIGSIIAWNKNGGGVPALPDGWVECNGQTLSDAQSPLNGQVIPNLNSGANSTFGGTTNVGRYLRGSTTSGAFQQDVLPNFEINQSNVNQGTEQGTVANNGSTNNFSAWLKNYYLDDSIRWRYNDREVRPLSYTVVWIMRVR